MTKRFQELSNVIYVVYNIINNTCYRHKTCKLCSLNSDTGCKYHSRIENNHQIPKLFEDKFGVYECCDDACETCKFDPFCSEDSTCGFSIFADHIIKTPQKETV